MATLGPNASPPFPSMRYRRRSCARSFERFCCTSITYLPLVFVYGITAWAVYVQAAVGFGPKHYGAAGKLSALLGVVLYILLNWSYTVAVFTDPGSPLTQVTNAYSLLRSPDADPETNSHSSKPHPLPSLLTVKSTGGSRYCKKCQTPKPDRAHHCSTCRRCVLKMDHHCPWLATCVGFRNYKAFLLFLIYTCLFCALCFWVSGAWVMSEIFNLDQIEEQALSVNCVLLAVLSGILGLVLSGFTGWHVYLASCNQTTIESLETTRYLSPIKRSMYELQKQQRRELQSRQSRIHGRQTDDSPASGPEDTSLTSQLLTIHANALPGVTRPEEGLTTPPRSSTPSHPSLSPAQHSLRQNLSSSNPHSHDSETFREQERYANYLDEVDSARLPHAFDLGWRANLSHLFGESLLLAWLPICNTTGDGWNWQASPKWIEKSDRIARERAARQSDGNRLAQIIFPSTDAAASRGSGASSVSLSDDDSQLGRRYSKKTLPPLPPSAPQPQPQQLRQALDGANFGAQSEGSKNQATANWNDIPDDFFASRGSKGTKSKNRNHASDD